MATSLGMRVARLLALTFALGIGAVLAAPPGSHIGFMWPVGLLSCAAAIAPISWAPRIVALSVAMGTISYVIDPEYSVAVSVGYGVGIGLEVLVTHQILTAGWTRQWRLYDLNDLGRLVVACLVGSATGGLIFGVVSALNDFGTPWRVGAAAFAVHLAGAAILLGVFRDNVPAEESYGTTERNITWGLTAVVTTIAFIPTDLPSLAFLVIPLLGWAAFRASTREAMSQLILVGAISTILSGQGLGPFANTLLMGLDREFQDMAQVAFLIACAMISIPFSLAVAMQRRGAQQLSEERERSERLVQSAQGIAIIGTDKLGRINLFSPGAEAILGYRPHEVYGQSTRMFHTEAEVARHAAELRTDPTYVSVVEATGNLPPGTPRIWQFIRKDRIPRTLSLILSPITDDFGQHVGYVATGDDITERIEAEAALEKALRTERRAVKRLTEIDQVKDQFVSSVSHELRTPITNIVGYLELLMDGVYGEPNSRQNDAMTRIDQNSRRLLTLIDDLLTLSSMENIDRRRRGSEIDLAAVVNRAEEIVRPSLLQRDLVVVVDVPDSRVPLIGDAGELERLVINLATNAIKFTPDGGKIVVRLTPADDRRGPILEVEDTGMGIHDEDRDKLFTRFFRTNHAHELGVPGSGLGLSIAKAIAEVHGGTISAESVFGQGSTFRVVFPLPEAVPVST